MHSRRLPDGVQGGSGVQQLLELSVTLVPGENGLTEGVADSLLDLRVLVELLLGGGEDFSNVLTGFRGEAGHGLRSELHGEVVAKVLRPDAGLLSQGLVRFPNSSGFRRVRYASVR